MCSPTLVFVSSEDNSLQGSADRIERSLDGTGACTWAGTKRADRAKCTGR